MRGWWAVIINLPVRPFEALLNLCRCSVGHCLSTLPATHGDLTLIPSVGLYNIEQLRWLEQLYFFLPEYTTQNMTLKNQWVNSLTFTLTKIILVLLMYDLLYHRFHRSVVMTSWQPCVILKHIFCTYLPTYLPTCTYIQRLTDNWKRFRNNSNIGFIFMIRKMFLL